MSGSTIVATKLAVVVGFETYKRGDTIVNQAEITRVLSGQYASYVKVTAYGTPGAPGGGSGGSGDGSGGTTPAPNAPAFITGVSGPLAVNGQGVLAPVVGNGPGTLAAGNDPRIANAVQQATLFDAQGYVRAGLLPPGTGGTATGGTGTAGAPGKSLLSGNGVPAASLGVNGDAYVNTDLTSGTGDLYDKTAGAWVKRQSATLRGPQGVQGPQGIPGLSGSSPTAAAVATELRASGAVAAEDARVARVYLPGTNAVRGAVIANLTVGPAENGGLRAVTAAGVTITATAASFRGTDAADLAEGRQAQYINRSGGAITLAGDKAASVPDGQMLTVGLIGGLLYAFVSGSATVTTNQRIALSAPATVETMASHNVPFSLQGFATAPTLAQLSFSLDGGAYQPLPTGSTVSASSGVVKMAGLANGTYRLTVKAADGTTSNEITYTVAAPQTATGPVTISRASRDASALSGNLAPLALPRKADNKAVAVPTLPVPLKVGAHVAGENMPVVCGHAFGPADVPSTHRVRLRRLDGTTVPVQTDGESHWPDGSLKWAILSFYAPGVFAKDQIKELVLDAVAGSPDRTASATLAQFGTEKAYKIKASGWTWGAETGVLDIKAVIAGTTVGAVTVNPTMEIVKVASGPLREEYLFRAALRRERDGAIHDSVVMGAYIRRWSTGAYEILARQHQPFFDRAIVGSTWETTRWNEANVGKVECFDGTRLVWALGGPNDRDARTVGPEAWADGDYLVPRGQNLGQASGIGDPEKSSWSGFGVPVGMTGTLPGGFTPNQPLFNIYTNLYDRNLRAIALVTARNRGETQIKYTAPPAGPTTVFPLIQSHPGGGAVLADARGLPFWDAPGERPFTWVEHDLEYLSLASRLFAPIDLSAPAPLEPPGFDSDEFDVHPYRPNQVYGPTVWDPGLHGDDWQTDRIGWLSRQHANWLRTPRDLRRRGHCVSLAFMQAEIQWDFEDQRSWKVAVFNNGPNASGNAYPGMAPPIPNIFLTYRDDQGINASSPGNNVMPWFHRGGSGYTPRYDPFNDGSHYPSWQIVPHLMTGHQIHLDIARTNTSTLWSSHDQWTRQKTLLPPVVPTARKFWSVFHDQGRADGWARLALSNLRYVLPTNHVEKAFFDDVAKDDAEYWGALAPHSPWKRFGSVPPAPQDGNLTNYLNGKDADGSELQNPDNWTSGFHQIYQTTGTLMAAYRGDTAWKPLVDVYLGFLRDAADDQQSPNGSGFFTGIYFASFNPPGSEQLYATRREWIEGQSSIPYNPNDAQPKPGVPPPFPDNRNWAGNHWADQTDAQRDQTPADQMAAYDVQQCAALALADWVGFPDCDRVRGQIVTRVMPKPPGVPLPRDRFVLGRTDLPAQLGLQWSIRTRKMVENDPKLI